MDSFNLGLRKLWDSYNIICLSVCFWMVCEVGCPGDVQSSFELLPFIQEAVRLLLPPLHFYFLFLPFFLSYFLET